jgi:murein DD-endopeptidase MepM/ murein hydrolase activator NlpD
MVAFGNPLAGTIHPKGWVRPAGNYEPVVTATFADHIAGGRNPGVDIGTGRCGDPILAMDAGKVTLAGLIGTAKVVRIKHANGYETAAAHLATIEVAVGQIVTRGQRIGTLGSTGATACHDHGGCKDPNGVEIDWWPLLIQNGATEDAMVPIPPGKFVQLANKVTKVTGAYGANFRAERLTTAPILKLYPVGTVFTPLMQADDGTSAGGATPTRWFGGFGLDDRGFAIFGWMHSSVVAVPSDVPAPAPDCSQKIADAVAPLNARIAAIKAKVAAGAGDIADD